MFWLLLAILAAGLVWSVSTGVYGPRGLPRHRAGADAHERACWPGPLLPA